MSKKKITPKVNPKGKSKVKKSIPLVDRIFFKRPTSKP